MHRWPCRIRHARVRWLLSKLHMITPSTPFLKGTGAPGCRAARTCECPRLRWWLLNLPRTLPKHPPTKRLIRCHPRLALQCVALCPCCPRLRCPIAAAPNWAAGGAALGASRLRLWRGVAQEGSFAAACRWRGALSPPMSPSSHWASYPAGCCGGYHGYCPDGWPHRAVWMAVCRILTAAQCNCQEHPRLSRHTHGRGRLPG